MPNNRDRIITYEQGDQIINALSGIKDALTANAVTGNVQIEARGEQFYNVFNSPVDITTVYANNAPISEPNCYYLFNGLTEFNQPIIIPDGVMDCTCMFSGCYNFNSPVTIGNDVANCLEMFYSCYNFNQPLILPNSIESYGDMLTDCSNFNSPITTCMQNSSSLYTYLNLGFSGSEYNAPIIIEDGVTDCSYMMSGAYYFNQSIEIPNTVQNCASMFYDCPNMYGNIYLNRTTETDVCSMIQRGADNSYPINVFCPNIAIISGNNYENSILGEDVEWTPIVNGFYNADYNVYILNNYPAA